MDLLLGGKPLNKRVLAQNPKLYSDFYCYHQKPAWRNKRLTALLALALLLVFPFTALAMDYGETGPYNVNQETVANPITGDEVTVFLPRRVPSPVPVMFFSHGLNAERWQSYRSLVNHVASQGVAVVYSPYPTSASTQDQYDILWNGFKRATDTHRTVFDLDNVGFFGHSWGAAPRSIWLYGPSKTDGANRGCCCSSWLRRLPMVFPIKSCGL